MSSPTESIFAKHGMVETMERTYRKHTSAVNAGRRRAHFTRKPAYVGMGPDCVFHLSDQDMGGDWRFDQYVMCRADGSTLHLGGPFSGLPRVK